MRKTALSIIIFSVVSAASYAQQPDSLLVAADSCYRAYDFSEAVRLYTEASESADSLGKANIDRQMTFSRNGREMTGYVCEPAVLARHRFSVEDFFLYYPMENGSWKLTPNSLDPQFDDLTRATYVPSGAEKLFFTSDIGGDRAIYSTEWRDTAWTTPALAGDVLHSTGREIYPIVSPDGRELYFASNGLFGVGGYDLYVSRWDSVRQQWGTPTNMGFPFSSPADDFLLVNTPDDKYTIFASNRACSRDSVDVYVLEYEITPVRKAIDDPERLRAISALEPKADRTRFDGGSSAASDVPENEETLRYVQKMEQVRQLRDSVVSATRELNEKRVDFATSDDEDFRAELTVQILEAETELPRIQDRLEKAISELQAIELDFLFKGVVIDPDKLMMKADREVVETTAAYTFTRMEVGTMPQFEFIEEASSEDQQ